MLLFSRQGKLRLQKWYVPLSDKEKKKITRELVQTVLARKPKMCSFLEWRDLKIVYKRWAPVCEMLLPHWGEFCHAEAFIDVFPLQMPSAVTAGAKKIFSFSSFKPCCRANRQAGRLCVNPGNPAGSGKHNLFSWNRGRPVERGIMQSYSALIGHLLDPTDYGEMIRLGKGQKIHLDTELGLAPFL